MPDKIYPKIGLALSGGGSRGYAHIGVIKILEQNNISVDFIAGSSAGALIGAMYSFFRDSKKLEQITLSNDLSKLLTLAWDFSFEKGIIRGEKIKKLLSSLLEESRIESLKIPFKAIASDFDTAKEVIISEGDAAFAVQASAAFPLVFKPVKIGEKNLWDGAISNPVPVDVAKKMGADIVIAVNLYNKTAFDIDKKSKQGAYEIAARSVESVQYNLAQERAKYADIIIEPNVAGLGFLGLDKLLKGRGESIILEGEKAAIKALPDIKEKIKIFMEEKNQTPIQKAANFFKKSKK